MSTSAAAWHREVRGAQTLSDALDVIERADAAGADFAALRGLQAAAVARERAGGARRHARNARLAELREWPGDDHNDGRRTVAASERIRDRIDAT